MTESGQPPPCTRPPLNEASRLREEGAPRPLRVLRGGIRLEALEKRGTTHRHETQAGSAAPTRRLRTRPPPPEEPTTPTHTPRPEGRPCLPGSAHSGLAALRPPVPLCPPASARPPAASPQPPATVARQRLRRQRRERGRPAALGRAASPRTGLAHGHGPAGSERGTPAEGTGTTGAGGSRRSPPQLYPLLRRPAHRSPRTDSQPSPAEPPPADTAPAAALTPRLTSRRGRCPAEPSTAQARPEPIPPGSFLPSQRPGKTKASKPGAGGGGGGRAAQAEK